MRAIFADDIVFVRFELFVMALQDLCKDTPYLLFVNRVDESIEPVLSNNFLFVVGDIIEVAVKIDNIAIFIKYNVE